MYEHDNILKNDSFHPDTGKFKKYNADGDVGCRRTRFEDKALVRMEPCLDGGGVEMHLGSKVQRARSVG